MVKHKSLVAVKTGTISSPNTSSLISVAEDRAPLSHIHTRHCTREMMRARELDYCVVL